MASITNHRLHFFMLSLFSSSSRLYIHPSILCFYIFIGTLLHIRYHPTPLATSSQPYALCNALCNAKAKRPRRRDAKQPKSPKNPPPYDSVHSKRRIHNPHQSISQNPVYRTSYCFALVFSLALHIILLSPPATIERPSACGFRFGFGLSFYQVWLFDSFVLYPF